MFTSAPAASASMGLCVFVCFLRFSFWFSPGFLRKETHRDCVAMQRSRKRNSWPPLLFSIKGRQRAVSPFSCLRRLQSSPRTFGLSGGWNSKFAKLPRRNRLCLFAAAAAATGQTKKTWWKNSHFLILLQLLLLLRPYRRPCDLGCRSLMIGMRKLPTWESRK